MKILYKDANSNQYVYINNLFQLKSLTMVNTKDIATNFSNLSTLALKNIKDILQKILKVELYMIFTN